MRKPGSSPPRSSTWRDFGAPAPIAIALRATAASGAHADVGIDLLRASVAAAAQSEARLEHAHSLVALGAAMREAGHPADARPTLREGLDLAGRSGATALAGRARRELRAAGGRPRREQITGVHSLTPSELRIARMAAAGHSNRQIAQDLFLTEHTIEVHLSRGYRKLGITSRRDLPAALAS